MKKSLITMLFGLVLAGLTVYTYQAIFGMLAIIVLIISNNQAIEEQDDE